MSFFPCSWCYLFICAIVAVECLCVSTTNWVVRNVDHWQQAPTAATSWCFSQSMIHPTHWMKIQVWHVSVSLWSTQHTEWRYKCDMFQSVYDPPNTLNEDTSVTCLSQSMIHPTHWMKIQVWHAYNTLNEDTSVTCLSQSMIHPTHWMKI